MKLQALLAIALALSFEDVVAQQKADIILLNANVTTLDDAAPHAEALAISKNRIVAVGNNKEIQKWKGAKTNVIDAHGKTVVPGLFDSHLHVIRGGRFYNTELRWDGVSSLKKALAMLREQAARTPEGQWVRVVGGWNEYQFEEKRLATLDEINEATGNVPTFILYLYGKAWLNKAGIQKLNITGETPNPPGGLIEKDSNGVPTGLLVAEPNAFILYSTLAKLPELTPAEKINSTLQYMTELNRLGVTAVMDAGGGFQNFPDDYAITDSLNRAGKITVRLPYFLFAQKKGTELNDFTKWISLVDVQHPISNTINEVDYRVEGGGENLVMDAADFENFLFPRPELPASLETNLKAVLALLVKNRWPFRLHATYNESISRDLAIIEAVNKETPLNGLLWFFDHAETVSDENLARIKALGGGVAVQHRMAYQGESFIHRYGKAAALSAPPIKKMLALGIPVGLGTDGTRVASYNPWMSLYWATTGKTLGGVQVMAPENVLDRTAALKLYTTGGYNLIREGGTKGKIKTGYLADVIVLDKDYFAVSDEDVKTITSLLTVVDGKIVWGSAEFEKLAPAKLPVVPAWSPVKYYGGYQK
ncbi:amidohydrolase [Chryseolinea lacunae]|uniref:Amidohydrolase n=1 Tax=Chryseolinea lacunae TaxID=2801331 RepID=A0ABS1KNN2_9BACT|nr:amidohydrolase [Chryseolinea lacunae]MBL0740945.1 amidohydrolase [Chryseolinea lacunae]